MTYVVTENCILCKSTDCVEVCPVDCFHEGANFMVIDPVECIDCGVCVPECPQEAIFADSEIPKKYQLYIELNKKLALNWPVLNEMKEPLTGWENWDGVEGKLHYVDGLVNV